MENKSLKYLFLTMILLFILYFYLNFKKIDKGKVEHICLFKLQNLNQDMENEIYQEITTLLQIPHVEDLSFGKNITFRNNQDFNFGLRVRFKNKKGLENYGPNLIHRNFVNFIKRFYLEQHLCFDWEI